MKTKIENGIKLVEIKGSFLNRGFYPAFDNEAEAPQGVLAWLEPKSETVSLSHPGKLAIALYNPRDFNQSSSSYSASSPTINGIGHKTNLSDEKNKNVYYELEHSKNEPLEWTYWAIKRTSVDGQTKVFLGGKSDGENYVTSELLYALRRVSSGTLLERVEDWCWIKGIPIRTICLLLETTIVCSIVLFIYKQLFNPVFILPNAKGATLLSAVGLSIFHVLFLTTIVWGLALICEFPYKKERFYKRLLRIGSYIASITFVLGYPYILFTYLILIMSYFLVKLLIVMNNKPKSTKGI